MSNEEQFKIIGPGEYRTRGGEKATVTTVNSPVEEGDPTYWNYAALGYVEDRITGARHHYCFTRKGRLFEDRESIDDIVGPWVEEKKEKPPSSTAEATPSEPPKTKEQLFGVAAGKFLEEVNTIYEGQARTCVVSVTVDLGEHEKCVTTRAGTLSSALGLVECVKRKLVDESERTWR